MTTERNGFTLIELTVAMAIAGIVVLLAHAVMTTVADAAARGISEARDADRAANRRLWLVRAFGSAVVGTTPLSGFEGMDRVGRLGEADRIGFTATIRTRSGVAERALRIGLDDGSRLIAESRDPGQSNAAPDTLVLATDLAEFGAEYLTELGAAARWVRTFVSPVSAPVAVRLRLTHAGAYVDTLLLYVGTRG